MRMQFQQLSAHLQRSLAPVYLICGEEPLQLGDAAQAVRDEARRQGFDERELLELEAGFDWGRLSAAADALSLFSARKLIELRLGGERIGREGAAAVRTYCESPAEDNLLLILAPGLERKELKNKWVQAVDRAGVVLQVWPIEGGRLVAWIEQRLRDRGLQPAPGVAVVLADRVEGNLLAAAQEIEKLRLLYGTGTLDSVKLTSAISDSARYDVFDLTDAALVGDRARVHRIISGLAAEGTAPALVLWAVARELRMLASAAFAARQGAGALSAVFDAHRVWESRRRLVREAIKRLPLPCLHGLVVGCALVDRQIKGSSPGDPWQGLAHLADDLAAGATADPPRSTRGEIC
ncbi:MAG: DNA polymerase III subunit delta [Pseudomonadota bacterium]|nr:DNA polymerase III subunit delta [Pseudomonadota bacterium]